MAERNSETVLGELTPEKLAQTVEFVMAQDGLPRSREELEMQRQILERHVTHETMAPDAAHLSRDESLQRIVRRQADICDALASGYSEEARTLREELGSEQ